MGAQINLPFFQFPLRWVRRLAVEPQQYPDNPVTKNLLRMSWFANAVYALAEQLKADPR